MTDQSPQGWGPPSGRPPNSGWGPQPPSPGRKRRPGVAGWIAIGVIALVVLGGCASVGDNQTTTAARQTDPSVTTGAPATVPPTVTAPPPTELPTTTAAPTTRPPTTRRPTPTTRKPTPTTRRPPQTTHAPARNCDPAYPDACLHDGIGDYDCAGGSGNGPNYVEGPITVRPPDPFGLDRDHDGVGCES
jgi:hypothetical protein